MKPRAGNLGEAVERLLPLFTAALVVTAGWFWFVQPRLAAYLRARTDTAALEERARTLQQASMRVPPPPADLGRTEREFEVRVSAEDEVADVATAIARAVLASAPADKLRSFVIETGDAMSPTMAGRSGGVTRASGVAAPAGADPRLALFPYAVGQTPLRVTFDSTFEAAGNVLWRMRDLPTIVEVRSVTLTRALPLMKTELLVRVWQRGDAADAERAAMPAVPAPQTPGPTSPRLAPSPADVGAPR